VYSVEVPVLQRLSGSRLSGLSIATRMAWSAMAFLAVGILATAGTLLYRAQSEMQQIAQSTLTKNMNVLHHLVYQQGDPRIEGNVLYFGQTPVNGNFAIVDQVKAIAGGTATIFMGDLRVATNVLKPDGTRAVGTKLAAGPAYDSVFKARKTFAGTVDILGTPYLTIYEPILEKASGNVIGILYVGLKRSEFFDSVSSMLQEGIIAAAAILVLAGFASFMLMRRMLLPLGALGEAMHRIAGGDLSKGVPMTERTDELGRMAGSIAVLLEAARQKIRLEAESQRIQASAEEERQRIDRERQKAADGLQMQSEELTRVLGMLEQGLSELSAGNLSFRIKDGVPAQYAGLVGDFNQAVEQLGTMVSTIQATAREIGTSAREINAGAGNLSQRTESQAHALQETAATSEQISATIRQTASLSQQAAETAGTALAAAKRGGDIAGQARQAMAAIEAASSRISDIIHLIDDIAFQTNLLALNASVEAARAGDAGKGFAVVASEVRMLAQRSAEAARDVAKLISATNTEVGGGVDLVQQVGGALDHIVSASERVAETIGQIANATSEQASGVQDMTRAVAHIDDMTQQNAALSEESAASATLLNQQIEQLGQLVSAFRTAEAHARLRRAA
jgi:methyl-accepting chemotaxis protein